MSVSSATRTFLKGRPGSPLSAVALELARRLDDPEEPSAAAVAKELRATLVAITELSAEKERTVDPLAAARNARAARKSIPKTG